MSDEVELLLKRQLRGDEGSSPYAYQDSEGWWTIGIGRLCDSRKPGSGLSDHEQDILFAADVTRVLAQVTEYMPWVHTLDVARKGAIMNMVFQMGVFGVLKFQNSLRLIRQARWEQAADNLLLSTWARQTPERAARIAKQIRTGNWQYAPGF